MLCCCLLYSKIFIAQTFLKFSDLFIRYDDGSEHERHFFFVVKENKSIIASSYLS